MPENENEEISWDFTVLTEGVIHHCRPDLIIVKKDTRECLIIDVAITDDHGVTKTFRKLPTMLNYLNCGSSAPRLFPLCLGHWVI